MLVVAAVDVCEDIVRGVTDDAAAAGCVVEEMPVVVLLEIGAMVVVVAVLPMLLLDKGGFIVVDIGFPLVVVDSKFKWLTVVLVDPLGFIRAVVSLIPVRFSLVALAELCSNGEDKVNVRAVDVKLAAEAFAACADDVAS